MSRFSQTALPNTCYSMRQRHSFFMILLLIIVLLIQGCSKENENRSIPAVPVKTAMAVLKDVPVNLSANGIVDAYSVVDITSRVDGQVMKIHIQEGQQVRKEQLLVTIDDRTYSSLLQTAQSNLSRDTARLDKARKDVERYTDLLKREYVTKNQYEQVLADAQSLEAIVKGDEAAVESARLNVSFCQILAPISGRAGSILINQGNLVKANDDKPLIIINQIHPVLIRFSIPEQHFDQVRNQIEKKDAAVTAALPDKPDELKTGRLAFMDNTISSNTGTINLKAVFENSDNFFWPGQFVKVMLTLGVQHQAVVVPSESIQMGQQGNYVFVIKNDDTAEIRNITAGLEIDGLTVITDGVTAGETIVTDGQLRLSSGTKVMIPKDTPATGDPRP